MVTSPKLYPSMTHTIHAGSQQEGMHLIASDAKSAYIWRHDGPIYNISRRFARHHNTRDAGNRPSYPYSPFDSFSLGSQLEPWPLERAGKAHLAIAPNRQRPG